MLEQAHVLTKGQPLLLQSLGTNIIEEFNATVRAGEERSNYVNFNDLEHAVQVLVKRQDNMAFVEHYKQLFDIIQQLFDEEILARAGVTYKFAVPLYRRWIAWRWEPITVKEEG